MMVFGKKSVNQWCVFLTLAGIFLLLPGCGDMKQRKAAKELTVQLQIPEGENPELFWYGVQDKILRVKKEGEDPKELSWQENTRIPLDLSEGDLLQFQATDRNARILIEGEAKITQEKNITIPVHRVL